MPARRRAASAHRLAPTSFLLFTLLGVSACGGGAPPAAPSSPGAGAKPVISAAQAVDLSPVAEPTNLVLVARAKTPDALVKTVGSWAGLPLPGASLLLQSATDDAIADAVDLSQPVDVAMTLGRGASTLIAISVAARSVEDAKSKLAGRHRLTASTNGSFKVEGVGSIFDGSSKGSGRGRSRDFDQQQEEEDESVECRLAPAQPGARIVCGDPAAVEALVPYLTRTLPARQWPADLHAEVRLAPVREPLGSLRAMLPMLAQGIFGSSSPAMKGLIDGALGELVDLAGDADRFMLDATLDDGGLNATMRMEYGQTNSVIARASASFPERAAAPPDAFWHLPAGTDTAFFSRGSDPKLFDHARELVANVVLEATESTGMPQAERETVRTLVADRILGLVTGPFVYGKGFEPAGVDRAVTAKNAAKPGDRVAADDAERLLAEQVVGWHALRVGEPVAKVGPILKDWSALWNRPAFVKWAKTTSSAKKLAKMQIVPMPAGVTAPKDSVHLEITIPRDDIEEPAPAPDPRSKNQKPAAPKKIARKPMVLHLYAIPDGDKDTWVGFGLDGKLVAQKVVAALATSPDAGTLGKLPGYEALRERPITGAAALTMRGLAVFTALDGGRRTAYDALANLPQKGVTPILFTSTAERPSAAAKAGTAVATLRVPRVAIGDAVKIVMSQ